MGGDLVDFFGIEFEAEHPLFSSEFEDLPGIYIIYTPGKCLDIGRTERLKTTLEEHQHTKSWLDNAGKKEIYVAFHLDDNAESREDKENYLREKMNPILAKV